MQQESCNTHPCPGKMQHLIVIHCAYLYSREFSIYSTKKVIRLNKSFSVITFELNMLIPLQRIVNGQDMDPGVLVQKSVEMENDPVKERKTLRQLTEGRNVTEPTINQRPVT